MPEVYFNNSSFLLLQDSDSVGLVANPSNVNDSSKYEFENKYSYFHLRASDTTGGHNTNFFVVNDPYENYLRIYGGDFATPADGFDSASLGTDITMDTSGNIGLGVIPDSSFRLKVNGDAEFVDIYCDRIYFVDQDTIGEPSNPPTGYIVCWADQYRLAVKNNSGYDGYIPIN